MPEQPEREPKAEREPLARPKGQPVADPERMIAAMTNLSPTVALRLIERVKARSPLLGALLESERLEESA